MSSLIVVTLKEGRKLTQVGADPASPGGYAARVAQLEMYVRMLSEPEPPGLLNKSLAFNFQAR